MYPFPMYSDTVPSVTVEQMIIVDDLMIQYYKISLIQMLENAGRCLAITANMLFLQGSPAGKTVVVLAGNGGNGGGAIACGRRLHNWGAHVILGLARPESELKSATMLQIEIIHSLGVPIISAEDLPHIASPDLVIDGVIGYSLNGDPTGGAASLIHWANNQPAPVLALDIPSGVDGSDGIPHGIAVRSTATVTLALPKKGLYAPAARAFVGDLYLADISAPPELYTHPSLGLIIPADLFAQSDIVRLRYPNSD